MEDDTKIVASPAYIAWQSRHRKSTAAPAAAAAAAPLMPVPSRQEIIERNKKINNAAAADAIHDFKAVRGENNVAVKTRELLQTLFGKASFSGNEIIQRMQTIGTFEKPDPTHLNEWDTFRAITGLDREAVQTRTDPTELTIAGMYDYSWSSYPIGKKEGGEYEWGLQGVPLFERIAGDEIETGLYFLIDAVNVKFYAALAGDTGATQKKAFFIHSRECLNDGAGKPWEKLQALTVPKRTVDIEIIQDDFAVDILYPPMKSDTTESRSLFNSIYTVRLQTVKKTREGVHTVCTSFLDSNAPEYSVTITKDSMEDAHPNSVNTLIQAIAPLFKLFQSDQTDTTRAAIYKRLQQKRAGDWLQALSCLDTARFKEIPAGSMVFFCTEDIIAAAYAIATGANVLFTYLKDSEYCIAVFRRNLAPLTKEEKEQAQLGAQMKAIEAALGKTIGGTSVADYYREYAAARNRAIADIEEDLTRVIGEFTIEALGGIQEGRVLPHEFKESVNHSMRAILRKFTDILAINFALALPPFSIEACIKAFEEFKAAPAVGAIKDIQETLEKYESIVETLMFSAGKGTLPATEQLAEFIKGVLASTARHTSVNTFSPFVAPAEGEVLSYVTTRGALFPLFQSVVDIDSAKLNTQVHRFIRAIEAVYSAVQKQYSANKDVKRFQAFIYSLKVVAGDEVPAPVPVAAEDQFELLQGVQAVDASAEQGLFVPLHRLIAWFKVKSIQSKEISGMFSRLRGGAIVTPPRKTQLKKKTRPVAPPRESKELLTSHPIVTIWFFYREMLHRIETSDHHESYTTLLEFAERWIQNWDKPFSSWNETARYLGVLEAFILGIFPRYSDYSQAVHLHIPAVDVEEITSTFAVAFLGKPHFQECEKLITETNTRVRECIELGTRVGKSYTLENFYETYTTILGRVFHDGKPAAPVSFIKKLTTAERKRRKKLLQTKKQSTSSAQKGTRKTVVKAAVSPRVTKTHRRGIGTSSKTRKNMSVNKNSSPTMAIEE